MLCRGYWMGEQNRGLHIDEKHAWLLRLTWSCIILFKFNILTWAPSLSVFLGS